MVDVIMNQSLFRLADRLLNGLELLRQIEAWAAVREHFNHLVKVPFGALQTLDDTRVSFVDMDLHGWDSILPGGIRQVVA